MAVMYGRGERKGRDAETTRRFQDILCRDLYDEKMDVASRVYTHRFHLRQ